LRSSIAPAASTSQAAAAANGGNQGGSSSASCSRLQGQYVDNMGSILLVKEKPATAPNAKPTYAYLSHTDKQLKFSKPS